MRKKSINKFSFQKQGILYELDLSRKVDLQVLLLSVTTEPFQAPDGDIGDKYYNSTNHKIWEIQATGQNGDYEWNEIGSPENGTLYLFSDSNYYWNGSSLLTPVIAIEAANTATAQANAARDAANAAVTNTNNSLEVLNATKIIGEWAEPVTTVEDLTTQYGNTTNGLAAMVTTPWTDGVAYVYSCNGVSWERTGLTAFPSDVAVKSDIYFVAGDMFSPATALWIPDSSFTINGDITPFSGVSRTAPFAIVGGKSYNYKGYGFSSTGTVVFFDSSFTALQVITDVLIGSGGMLVSEIIVAPSNATYAGLSCDTTILNAQNCGLFINEEVNRLRDKSDSYSRDETISLVDEKIGNNTVLKSDIYFVAGDMFSPIALDWIPDTKYDIYGVRGLATGMSSTDPFMIIGGKSFEYVGYGFSTTGTITLFKEDGITVDSVITTPVIGNSNGDIVRYTFTAPTASSYAALTCDSSILLSNPTIIGLFIKEAAVKYRSIYDTFTSAQILSLLDRRMGNYSSLKINVLADSISLYGLMDGYNGWFKQLINRMDIPFANIGNYAIGGNCLSAANENILTGNPASPAMCFRFSEMSSDADVIFVMGGANDGNGNVGTLAELTNTTPNSATFVGSMRIIIEGLYSKYNTNNIKIIWGIFPRHFSYSNATDHSGVSMTDLREMVDTMISVLHYYGIPYINFYDDLGINIFNVRPHPNVAPDNLFIDNGMINGSGTLDLVDGYRTSGYISTSYGKSYVSSAYCFVAFFSDNGILSLQRTDGAYALMEYIAPLGTTKMKVSKAYPDNTFYLTESDGTMMCDVVHPTISAQKKMAELAIKKFA